MVDFVLTLILIYSVFPELLSYGLVGLETYGSSV
jgi:hypothetical protein